jgi:hypothetical protein
MKQKLQQGEEVGMEDCLLEIEKLGYLECIVGTI